MASTSKKALFDKLRAARVRQLGHVLFSRWFRRLLAICYNKDTVKKTWRHLDFFQHQAFLHARVARIDCPDCGVRLVNVPWARPGSGFTLLFEAFVMTLVKGMPVAAAARLVGEYDTRLWRVIQHYVETAVARMDLSDLRRVAIDETSAKRGHDYISLFVDIDARKVVYVTEGNDAETVARFADHVDDHNSGHVRGWMKPRVNP